METQYMISPDPDATGIDHKIAVALARHRDRQRSGKVFTFDVNEDRSYVGDCLLSTVHHKTGNALAALGPDNRKLVRQWLDAKFSRLHTNVLSVAIEPPSDECPKPAVYQVVRETGLLREVFHFSPME